MKMFKVVTIANSNPCNVASGKREVAPDAGAQPGFWRRGDRIWVPATKGSGGVTLGKLKKNLKVMFLSQLLFAKIATVKNILEFKMYYYYSVLNKLSVFKMLHNRGIV